MASVKLTSRFGQVARDLRMSAPDRVERVANDIAERAAANAPSDSGDLRGSIKVEQVGPFEFAVTADRPWRYLEFGTVKMGARPFMVPAAQGGQTKLGRMLREVIQ